MRKSGFWLLVLAIIPVLGYAQFDPAGGEPGSLSVKRDDPSLIAWATSVSIQRGLQQINDSALGFADAGTPDEGKGAADGRVVSLGDGGIALLEFDPPFGNQEGFDFAVFENGFAWNGGYFLELAFVEVSSNGRNFVQFPAVYSGDTSSQIENLSYMQPEWYHNLAGKHQAPYGTLFDLDSLPKSDSLNLNSIRFVRLTDVVGCLLDSFKRRDSRGFPINDPWPNPPEPNKNAGFDLDAVGVISGHASWVNNRLMQQGFNFPTLFKTSEPIHFTGDFVWRNIAGSAVNCPKDQAPSAPGLYWVLVYKDGNQFVQKVMVTE
ncbi:MAG: T9SS C-terminal target domain-containing protein [Bacteroidetes bacterium]|nr:T9SS C-terminal target domain-containing protein [Bacteroidota bacterium]